MKRTLLFSCLMVLSAASGQKLLNATVDKYYDQSGTIDYIDSAVYSYSSFQGYFNEFKPTFGYDGDIMYFFLEDKTVHCNTEDTYNYQGAFPLTLIGTDSNLITNDLVSQATNSGGYFRSLYWYDNQNRLTNEVFQSYNGSDWVSYDSTVTSYDILGNKTAEVRYSVSTSPAVISYADSLFYVSGTNNLMEAITYYSDGTALSPGSRTLISWAGNNIDYLDIFSATSSGSLAVDFRLYYTYNGSEVTGFEAFEAINGVPNPTLFGQGYFMYNAQNNPQEYTFEIDGMIEEGYRFSYDSEDFLSEIEYFFEDSSGNITVDNITSFYFTSIASVKETELLEVQVYPNPTIDLLKIQAPELISSIQVVNMNGQVVLTQNNVSEINVGHLPNGNYILQGKSANKVFSSKFLKY